MDVKIGDWVVTPRIGKPVEVEALWLTALWMGSRWVDAWEDLVGRGREAFRTRFWHASDDYLGEFLRLHYGVLAEEMRSGVS